MILIDTGPLVALCDERDALHKRSLAEVDKIGSRATIALAAVLCEACFLLDTLPLRARLQAILAKLEIGSLVDEHSRDFRESVFSWLEQYADQKPDFADACLAVASSRDKAAKVWTFDAEFTTTWRRPDGSRIPLAVNVPSSRRKRWTRSNLRRARN